MKRSSTLGVTLKERATNITEVMRVTSSTAYLIRGIENGNGKKEETSTNGVDKKESLPDAVAQSAILAQTSMTCHKTPGSGHMGQTHQSKVHGDRRCGKEKIGFTKGKS